MAVVAGGTITELSVTQGGFESRTLPRVDKAPKAKGIIGGQRSRDPAIHILATSVNF